ncbi:MAG: alkaline shock response membrane anchor protein AmaP [Candidatus Omnitrophica bacterium]|nr:alkaline shock response membrane anchor protein AmaP [Candidatus Omnitrophota bacterium]
MKVLHVVAMIFYALVTFIVALLLIGLSSGFLTMEFISQYYHQYGLQLTVGIAGLILFCINFLILRFVFMRGGSCKCIRIETEKGTVTISISAIKALTRRLLEELPEVKDMRPFIFTNRKGIDVMIKTSLYTGTPVPEVSEKIQTYIMEKLQETLGAGEEITVRIQVDKIEQIRNREEG